MSTGEIFLSPEPVSPGPVSKVTLFPNAFSLGFSVLSGITL
jgi:hypothetical protein